MKSSNLAFIAVFLTSVLVVGCKNVPPVTSGTGTSKIVQGDDFSQHLEVHNPDLADKLQITDIKSRKTNDLLEVNLELTSSYKKSLQLQYHFNWFDTEGFVIEPGKAAWKPLELHGFQTATLRGIAPTTTVASFSVYVREVPEKAFKF